MMVVLELFSVVQCFFNIMYCIIIFFIGYNMIILIYFMSDQNFICRMFLFEYVMIEICWIQYCGLGYIYLDFFEEIGGIWDMCICFI